MIVFFQVPIQHLPPQHKIPQQVPYQQPPPAQQQQQQHHQQQQHQQQQQQQQVSSLYNKIFKLIIVNEIVFHTIHLITQMKF